MPARRRKPSRLPPKAERLAPLPDPEVCLVCGGPSAILRSTDSSGRRLRRHECLNPACMDEDDQRTRWTTYESRMDPVCIRLTKPKRSDESMNLEQVRERLEAKLTAIPSDPDSIEGLSRAQWAAMVQDRRAAERQLTVFDRLAARLPKAREAVATLTRQIKHLTDADREFVAEREELEPKTNDRDWREAQRITNRVQELNDALRQIHSGLVSGANGWSHPAVESFLRAHGEPLPASGSIWIGSRYSALPTLKDRLTQARAELDAVEEKIKRESA